MPSDRPLFEEIKAQLYMIRDLHNYQLVSQDSLDCFDDFDDIIQPQPPIRLSLHREHSASPSHLLDSPTSHSEYVFPVLHPRPSHECSSSQPKSSSPLNRAMGASQLHASKSVTIVWSGNYRMTCGNSHFVNVTFIVHSIDEKIYINDVPRIF